MLVLLSSTVCHPAYGQRPDQADLAVVAEGVRQPVTTSEQPAVVATDAGRTSIRVLALVGVLASLLVAIARFNVHPFLALLISGLLLGPVSGLDPVATVEAFLDGFAGLMKSIGVVIVLGALIGGLLSQSGGTMTIARTLMKVVGPRRLPLAMGITGYVVSIPAFVDIAYIMLRPIVEVLAVKSKRNVLVVGLSLTAGLTASHALLPPTPGPLATAGLLGADLGRVISINVFVAAFAVLGGLLWATLFCGRVRLPYDDVLREKFASEHDGEQAADSSDKENASFLLSIAPILLPLVLIALGAFLIPKQVVEGTVISQDVTGLLGVFQFLSIPAIALLCGAFAGTFLLKRGTRLAKLSGLVETSIEHSAVVLMITAAGGGLGAVIKATGVGDDIAAVFQLVQLPAILFPFLLAATLTTATGSLTVSMVTSSSIVVSMLPSLGISPELAVALIGAGSLCIIHANSSFFWLLSRLHDVPPSTLYRTYSVQSVCMSLGGLVAVLLLRFCGLE
ncbi:GntP family permease [Rubripirellula tenax]|nr:SLC13 family permease [Rubripirellula tenax]